MLTEGIVAPDFRLPGTPPSDDQDIVSEYSLREAITDGPVLLNFYLFDFHPHCTENICDLHDLAWFDIHESVSVYGISTDKSFSHRAFAETEDLDVTLLSDSDGTVAEEYGVLYDEFGAHKRIAKRAVFIVDSEGIVRYAWRTEDPSVQPDWQAVRTRLREITPDSASGTSTEA